MDTNASEVPGPRADVRPAAEGDVVEIRSLAVDNGMFTPDDMAGFDEMLRGYLVLYFFAVHPRVQRLGIGTALVAYVEQS